MFPEYADEYREWAEQCLAFAAAAWRLEAKTACMAIALKWQRLWDKADKLGKQQSQEERAKPGTCFPGAGCGCREPL